MWWLGCNREMIISGLSVYVSDFMLGLLDGDSLSLPPVRVAGSSPWLALSFRKCREALRERAAKAHKWSLDPPGLKPCMSASVKCTKDSSLLL